MSDPVKIQKLTNLVETSTILNAQEKSEWLALMQLMNDKQLSELEEILKPAAPSITPVSNNNETQGVSTPPLSHISNLPSQMVDPRIKARPLEMFHSSQPAKPAVKTPVQSPRVPEPRPQPRVQAPSPIIPKIQPITQPEPIVSPPQKPLQTVAPKPEFNPEPVTPTTHGQVKVAPTIQLSSLDEASTLTSAALHEQTREGFYKAIIGLAEQFGYFQVLSQLELSPLYKDYLVYGKVRLNGGPDDNLPLSQEEFEFVADLLTALKINRV